jgi:hypothetical protein
MNCRANPALVKLESKRLQHAIQGPLCGVAKVKEETEDKTFVFLREVVRHSCSFHCKCYLLHVINLLLNYSQSQRMPISNIIQPCVFAVLAVDETRTNPTEALPAPSWSLGPLRPAHTPEAPWPGGRRSIALLSIVLVRIGVDAVPSDHKTGEVVHQAGRFHLNADAILAKVSNNSIASSGVFDKCVLPDAMVQ